MHDIKSQLRNYLDISRNRIYRVFFVLVFILTIFALLIVMLGSLNIFSEPINDATRANVSKHVSDMSCRYEECPGQLICYRSFNESRVGTSIEGARCVTPDYEEHYCGIFEISFIGLSQPPVMKSCMKGPKGPDRHVSSVITEDDLIERVWNTDQEEKLIYKNNLSLAIESGNN